MAFFPLSFNARYSEYAGALTSVSRTIGTSVCRFFLNSATNGKCFQFGLVVFPIVPLAILSGPNDAIPIALYFVPVSLIALHINLIESSPLIGNAVVIPFFFHKNDPILFANATADVVPPISTQQTVLFADINKI